MATESVKTIRPSGGDYSLLSAWEAGEQRDLTLTDEIAVAEVYNEFGSPLDDPITIDGWVTDSTRYVVIRAASGQEFSGVPGNAFTLTNTAAGLDTLVNNEQYTRVIGIEIHNEIGDSLRYAGRSGSSSNQKYCRFYRCAFKNPGGVGVRLNKNSQVDNCLIYDSNEGVWKYPGHYCRVYNSVIANCATGVTTNDTTGYFRANNLVFYGCGTDFNGAIDESNSSHIATTKAAAPTVTGAITGITSADFVNPTAYDFHLSASSVLRGAGTSALYSPYFSEVLTDPDIDGDPRTDPWDLGYDQYVASSGTITGTAAVSLVTLAAAGSGDIEQTGGASTVIPSITSAAAGDVSMSGSAGVLIQSPGASLIATIESAGQVSVVLQSPASNGSGSIEGSTSGSGGAAVLPPQISAAGETQVQAGANAQIQGPTASASGDVLGAESATVQASLSSLLATATGDVQIQGASVVPIRPPSMAASASISVDGQASASIRQPDIFGSGATEEISYGAIAASITLAAVIAAGTVGTDGAIAAQIEQPIMRMTGIPDAYDPASIREEFTARSLIRRELTLSGQITRAITLYSRTR